MDEQLALLLHEKMDLLKRLEEDQEDLNELMKKHKALIAQVMLSAWPAACLSASVSDLNRTVKANPSLSPFLSFSPPVTSLRSESYKLN